ncbi:class I adenylate-forming enzyme family protein [Pradoshia sp.]
MFISKQLKMHASKHPERVITSFQGHETTYQQFYEKACHLAGYLKEKGFTNEDIIALYLPNSDSFLIAYYACQMAGLPVLPINTKLAPPEVEYILQHSEAKALIYDARLEAGLQNIGFDMFQDILVIGGENSFEDVINASKPHFEKSSLNGEDTAVIFYTSGTTGRPKGVMLSVRNVESIAEIWADSLELSPSDRMQIVTPLFHCAASHCFSIPTIQRGGTVIIEEAFSPIETLYTMERERVTVFFGVPAIYSTLLNTPLMKDKDLSHLRLFAYGAAPMPYELVKQLKNSFPNVMLQNLYGQTENSPGATTLKDKYALEKIGSVGEPLPHTEVRVVDSSGRDVAPGEVGEILVKGPQVMKGYLKNKQATEAALKNGWLYSGDLGKLDEDGLLYIVDRKKDMLIRGGENVYPIEVEEVLYQMEEILEAAVVGIPHETYGEVPKAYVVLKDSKQLTEEEIIQYCLKNLAKYKVPMNISFIDELPRNASGKVLKHTLREKSTV